jgi:hypothetical protein
MTGATFEPLGSLTGRVRYRSNWRGKLILQVEFHDISYVGYVRRFTNWRDAKLSDISGDGSMPSIIVRDKLWPFTKADMLDVRGAG